MKLLRLCKNRPFIITCLFLFLCIFLAYYKNEINHFLDHDIFNPKLLPLVFFNIILILILVQYLKLYTLEKLRDFIIENKKISHRFVLPEKMVESTLPIIIKNIEDIIIESDRLAKRSEDMESQYQLILDNQPEIVFLAGDDGFITYNNKAFDLFFGNPLEKIEDIGSLDNFSPNFSNLMAKVIPIFSKINDTKDIHLVTIDIKISKKNYILEFSISAIDIPNKDSVKLSKYLIVGRDITEQAKQRKEDEAIEKLVTIGKSASSIFHEINQPISAIQIYANIIRDDMLKNGNQQRKFPSRKIKEIQSIGHFDDIFLQLKRVNQIIKNFRLLNPTEQGNIKTESINPDQIIKNVLSYIEHNLISQSIKVTHNLYQIRSTKVQVNATLFTQVIQNILLNSTYALSNNQKKGNREITITTTSSKPGNITISIQDNGGGVSEDILNKLTEPFFTTKPIGIGSGIGLALCTDIIHRMGGEIYLYNTTPAGLTNEITLPTA